MVSIFLSDRCNVFSFCTSGEAGYRRWKSSPAYSISMNTYGILYSRTNRLRVTDVLEG